jgi:Ion channel
VPIGAPASAKEKLAMLRQRTRRYTTLLLAELALILVYPFFSELPMQGVLPRVLGAVVFSAALYAVLGKGRTTTIAFLLGGPAILLRMLDFTTRIPAMQLVDQILGLVFMIFVTSNLVWTIVSDPSVTTDTIAGAVSAYLLIGITFGSAYVLINHLLPGSFRDTIEPGKHLSPPELTFFSFVTLTTVGYGDIVPWLPHARSVAMLEAVVGIMYPAVLISRIVGTARSGT